MQLKCPECGETVQSTNINIQEMVAVCPACDNVFHVVVPKPKVKRRKVYQPQDLTLREDEHLHISFRTNFRLDKNEEFLRIFLISIVLTIITGLTLGTFFDGELTAFMPIMTATVTLMLYYRLATIVYNKTHIDMTDDTIQISRQPLPALLNHTHMVSLFGVESISSEETEVSKKEAYDTPRYNVWANMEDGTRKVIVSDVTESYGLFIAQRLNERLQADEPEIDISRLENVTLQDADDLNIHQLQTGNQNHKYSH